MKATDLETQLDAMSLAELQTLKHAVSEKIETRAKQERAALIDKMDMMAKERGFAGLDALLNAKDAKTPETKTRKPVAPKYRNPADAEQTWTGRGRQPKWIKDVIESGGSLEDMLIDMDQAA